MAIVEPLPAHQDGELEALASVYLEALGFVPNSFMTLQRRPAIAKALATLIGAAMAPDPRVTSEFKRCIGQVASYASGCRYCQAHLATASRRYGASDERIANIWDWERSDLFTPAERAALAFAQAAASVPNAVDPAIEAELKAHWSDDEIVDILGVVAAFGFLNRWNDSMGTTLEDEPAAFAEGLLGPKGWSIGKHG